MQRVLVVASTFPASDTDPVPAFVKDQIIALRNAYPDLVFTVLAPHDARSRAAAFTKHEAYDEYRFHYCWPFTNLERLAGRGIVPTLKRNPAYYALVPFLFISEFFALLRLARKLRPAIMYAHWFTPQGITAGAVSLLTGVPFVYTSHSSDVAFLRKIPVAGPRLVRYFSKRAQAITVVSRRSLSKLQAFFTAEEWQGLQAHVAVIPMGVDLQARTHVTNTGRGTVPVRLLFIGRMAEKKGVQYLLPAFARLKQHHPDLTLTVAGDGPLLASLKAQAVDLMLHDVHFSGHVSGTAKEDLITAADMFVVPSIIAADGDAEGLPVALLEGLAAGKVCIATNESGADDIIQDGISGYLVPQKDVGALAAAIEQALVMKPAARHAMQRAARETAQQFAWLHIAKLHYDFLFKGLR